MNFLRIDAEDVVDDFVECSNPNKKEDGYFRRFESGIKFSLLLSKKSCNKWKRYKIVPFEFFGCLEYLGYIKNTIPENGVSLKETQKILDSCLPARLR